MRVERMNDNCIFAFISELEPVWGALSVLSGETIHTLCTEIYGAEQITAWKRKYGFLFETFKVVDATIHANLVDYLLEMPIADVTLEHLRDTLLALPAEEFVWRHLGMEYLRKNASLDTLRQAMTDDEALDEVYSWISEYCTSFLAFSAFVRQSKRFLTDFFSLATEMRTPTLADALEKQSDKIERLCQRVKDGASGDLLELSQELMGKTFRNRGPYSEFVFLPSYLIPVRACRYFDTNGETMRQYLFLSLRTSRRDREDTVKALRAIADPTRYQILTILAQEGPMRGLDIAKRVSIATSTVSHHMEQMKECGLVTEEPVKNSKYYGLSKQSAKALLDEIAKDLEIE